MNSTTDVRLALVMNGGVSLAVWMAGVTHEIDLLRRASESLDNPDRQWAPVDEVDEATFLQWQALCKYLDVRVKVDVIAGSSAGGLNGSLLAASIAKGGGLPNLGRTWAELASLERPMLLPDSATVTTDSVLDGKFFAEKASNLIAGIIPGEVRDRREVSLFVTATALQSGPKYLADSSGSGFSVADHRRLYRFRRHRIWQLYPTGLTGVKEVLPDEECGVDDFKAVGALGLAVRASAGFPIAFTPVQETRELREFRDLRIGGSVAVPATEQADGGAWLIDGGVLDNAPFTPVLDEIAQQTVDAPWRRAVIYVVPSGEETPSPNADGSRPPWTSVVAAALEFPTETDVRTDFEDVGELMRRAARWVQTPDELFGNLMFGESSDELTICMRVAAAALGEQYRQSRLRAGVLDAVVAWRSTDAQPRLAGQIVCQVNPTGLEQWVPSIESGLSFAGHNPWRWGTAVADRVLRLLLRHLRVAAQGSDRADWAYAIDEMSKRVQQCVAIRQAVVGYIESQKPSVDLDLTDQDLCQVALTAIDKAMTAYGVQDLLGELVCDAVQSFRAAIESPVSDSEMLSRALLVEINTRAFADRETFERVVDFEFHRFGPDCDSLQIPTGPWANEAIGDWKLWGTHVRHFGAFGSREWREWDWAWGRVDGAHHLFNLLAAGRVDGNGESPETPEHDTLETLRQELLEAIERAEGNTLSEPERQANLEALWAYRNSDGALLRDFRDRRGGDETVRQTIDAVLQLLRNQDRSLPRVIRTAGPYASFALVERPVPGEKPGRGLKGLALRTGLRLTAGRTRRWLYGPRKIT